MAAGESARPQNCCRTSRTPVGLRAGGSRPRSAASGPNSTRPNSGRLTASCGSRRPVTTTPSKLIAVSMNPSSQRRTIASISRSAHWCERRFLSPPLSPTRSSVILSGISRRTVRFFSRSRGRMSSAPSTSCADCFRTSRERSQKLRLCRRFPIVDRSLPQKSETGYRL